MRKKAMACRVVAAALLALALPALNAQSLSKALPLTHVDHGKNSAKAENAHYVVMVSLDGFRWDYAKRDNAAHLLALAQEGVWAPEGMLPSYPSLTFPNHYTLVTGLYPEHHGLVANGFYDPARNERYSMSDTKAVTDGSWYGGVPLWSLAESQGMRSAVIFWPGSEAEIAGFRPTWYARFNRAESSDAVEQARIDNAVALLKMPAEERPHLILIYYSEPDHEGHEFGPDAKETRAAVRKMDGLMGKLKAALDETKLPVNLVVVSDHGMVREQGDWITLDQYADLSGFTAVGDLLYGKTEEDRARVYEKLKKAAPEFKVYRRKNVPAELNYNQNAREGDPVVVATGPYPIRAHAAENGGADKAPLAGMHGFDPQKVAEMKASFFAAGPDIVKGNTVTPFENVNLYPWVAHILGLAPPKNDGSLNILANTLRDGGAETGNESEK
jgi:predicted AlkP superfamily pyrophosphatase or phosphodiesterase